MKECPHCGKNTEPTIDELIEEIKALRNELQREKSKPPIVLPAPAERPPQRRPWHPKEDDFYRKFERERQKDNQPMWLVDPHNMPFYCNVGVACAHPQLEYYTATCTS